MRTPTPPESAYRWYAAAIAHVVDITAIERPAIDENDPQPGWYERRFSGGAVFVPARIWIISRVMEGELIEPEELACEIGGERFDPYDVWSSLCQRPITQTKFLHMMKVRAWANGHARAEPEADPFKPVDFHTLKAPVWRKSKRGS